LRDQGVALLNQLLPNPGTAFALDDADEHRQEEVVSTATTVLQTQLRDQGVALLNQLYIHSSYQLT
ncbi:hypothetical protein WP50_33420, partial [Lactiplantibacillus plantarum]